MTQPSLERRSKGARWRRTAGVLALTLIALTVFAGALRALVDAHTLGLWVDAAKPYLLGWRLFLFAVVFGLWPFWVRTIGARRRWSAEQSMYWINQRWRIAGWAVAIELIVVQNAIGHLVGALT